MGKETTKDALLDAGRRIFLERGYNHSGIEAVLQSAGVPKGSFYHYFESKEDFGLQVLDRFAGCVNAELDRHLNDERLGPLERLRRFGESVCEKLESRQCRNGCLVGNLSQEMADQSEAFRARLDEIFRGWADRYAGCLEEAREAGEIPADLDSRELAEFWVSGWQGALMRAKTARSTAPIQTFLKLMFGYVLRK
jgi:TetR/AcrR family transcriptional repressor of nem operon